MKDILELLINNWKLIAGFLFFLIGFIIAIIRKRPLNDILTDIYSWCLEAIKDTEIYSQVDPNFKGQEKLTSAINYVGKKLLTKYPTLNVSKYYFLIEKVIEDILSTPHKKDV